MSDIQRAGEARWTPPPPSPPAAGPTLPPAPPAPGQLASYSPSHAELQTDQRPVDTVVVVLAWVAAIITVGYFLPWAIAASRGKSNQAAIGLLNLLLGWTVVGWVVALVMACTAHRVAASTARGGPPPGWYPSPSGQGTAYWDGRSWTGHSA